MLWQHLADADDPVPAAAVGDAVWAAIGTDEYGEDAFADPKGAEQVVRRDTGSLLRLCQDIGLVRSHDGGLVLSQFGRSRRWAHAWLAGGRM